MSTGLEPAVWPPPQTGGEHATREWLDALASGRCDADGFSRAMHDRFQSGRNGNWEVLSLLDQYFRRGKIKPEVFQSVKARLEVSALGAEENPAAGARPQAANSSPATSPPPAAPASAAPRAAPRLGPEDTLRRAARGAAVGDLLRRRYRLVSELSRGGSGTVFEATDDYRLDLPSTDLRVALKVLRTPEQQREFQHLQLLSHPNIVRVHEFDRDGGIDFFTMEFLRGALLGQLLAARNGSALPRPYALAIIRDVGEALAYAHARGVVHGDLNPHNVFITSDGELRLLGFAASRPLLEGRNPDARDDVYALGCVAYTLLSGREPFPQHTALEARLRRLRPMRPARLAGEQWRALRHALHWERAKRPADIRHWLDSFGVEAAALRLPPLTAMLRTPPARARHLVLKTAAVTLFALLVGSGVWLMTQDASPARSALTEIGAAITRLTAAQSSKTAIAEPAPVVAVASVPPETATAIATAPGRNRAAAAAPSGAAGASAAAAAGAAPGVAAAAAPSGASAADSSVPQGAVSIAAWATSPSPARHPETARGTPNAGPIRLEMADDTMELAAADRTAHVIVRRKGNAHGDAHFTWWTESGTAKPGVDFAPVAPHEEDFPAGSSSFSLNVPVSGAPHSAPKSFYVMIGPAESGATLGARTLTLVTLLPADR